MPFCAFCPVLGTESPTTTTTPTTTTSTSTSITHVVASQDSFGKSVVNTYLHPPFINHPEFRSRWCNVCCCSYSLYDELPSELKRKEEKEEKEEKRKGSSETIEFKRKNEKENKPQFNFSSSGNSSLLAFKSAVIKSSG